ncbi:hypothetical protein Bhyg_01604 [Pseudolycoriella hygida]|uniref:Uncharacterized protein n=1 Tax=Pseudolycoriella hygida TaxID=35572 RepID=A0A9Q0NA82_9DIPT|nr:hypothetical protein Bhyg_01604 [Pseudolycoriella hygida]
MKDFMCYDFAVSLLLLWKKKWKLPN